MSNAPFNISLVIRADTGSAKAGLTDVATGLKTVSTEAGKASAATAREAADLNALAQATAKAALAQDDLAAAAKRTQTARSQTPLMVLASPAPANPTPAVAPVTAAWRASETAAESLRGTVAGLSVSIGDQAHDMVAASQAAAAYQSALDDVRASFNPIFAASRQYEQQLDRIAEAEKLGALTAREAAQARADAARIIAPSSPGGAAAMAGHAGTNSAYTSSVAAQGFDIGVTAAMGMSPMQIGLQQGTQIVQAMEQMGGGKAAMQGIATGLMSLVSPINIATIGLVALGAAGIQALMSLGGEVKSLDDRLEALSASTDAYAKSSDRARMGAAGLRAEFGSVSGIARQLLADMAELDRRTAGRDAAAVVKALPADIGLALKDPVGEADDLRKTFGLSTWKQESWDMARGVRDAYLGVGKDTGLDEQITAVQRLKDAYTEAAGAAGGITKEEDAALTKIQQALDQLMGLKARDENAAGNTAADEMVRQLRQRVQLEQVAIAYGEDSVEYRAAENAQARENLVLELGKLGITEKDQKAKEVLGALAQANLSKEQAAAEARRKAQQDYLNGQDDQIGAMQRELALIGASNAERIRAAALAEAEIEIRKRSLSIGQASEVRDKAIAKADAEIKLERDKGLRAASVAAMGQSYDARIALARDPVSQANLELQKEFTAQLAAGEGPAVAYANALNARNRAMSDALVTAQSSIASMMDEVAIRRDLDDQVAAGLITSADANRLLQEETTIRPLLAAAARAEGAERKRLLDLVEGLRVAYAALAAEEQRSNQNEYLRGQAERTRQLELELALVGQTEEVRARVLALTKAEQDIRRLGLSGDAAETVRKTELANLALADTLADQTEAWRRVQAAGESAIDGVLDKLRDGDTKGALAAFAEEIGKAFFDLNVRNPVKNMLLGTDLPTLDDIGGLGGVWARLTGQNRVDEGAVAAKGATPVQAMTVTAANVTLSGNLSGIAAGANPNAAPLTAANANVAPLSYGTVPGSADVQAQVWSFFAARGLQPHQIAAIMGNVAGESSFNPLSQGDYRNGAPTSFGLFQHHDERGQGLLEAVGGMSGLGNVQAQLEYVWQELLTTQRAALERLKAAPDVSSATDAWMRGFERPSDEAMSKSWGERLAAAEAAMAQFGDAATAAAAQVAPAGAQAAAGLERAGQGAAVAGHGVGIFGQALSGIGALVGGSSGGALQLVASIGSQLLQGVPLFNTGGFTGGTDPDRAAGIVHQGEFVFDAAATKRIGVANLEGIRKGSMRGFKAGGLVSSLPTPTPTLSLANRDAAPGGASDGVRRMEINANISGTGNAEIRDGVMLMIEQALDGFARELLPDRVRAIVNDRWSA